MCIRDRCSTERARRLSLRQQAFLVPAGTARTCPVYGNLHDCLLYTSDAADERSSVDLGGRRIIKKKQRRSTRRGRASDVDITHTHTSKVSSDNRYRKKSTYR